MSHRFYQLSEKRLRAYMKFSLHKFVHCKDRKRAAVWMSTFQELSATLHLKFRDGSFSKNYCGQGDKMRRQAENRSKYQH